MRMVLAVGLMLFAAPVFAQDAGCYDCRSTSTAEAEYVWCGTPPNDSWGYDQECQWLDHNGVTICRRVGNRCYYFEVNG